VLWNRATKAPAPPPAVAFRASAARSLCCRRSAASSWWRFFRAEAASLRGDRILLPLDGIWVLLSKKWDEAEQG